MTAPVLKPAATPLIAQAWARTVPGIPAAAVGLQARPAVEKWAATGFITTVPVGGSPDLYLPQRNPVIQFDCWAFTLNSEKVPYGQAQELADRLVNWTWQVPPAQVSLPAQYKPVWVAATIARGEIRHHPEEESGYAHFSADIEIQWIEREP